MIKIGGLQKVSLIDYPGKVAASVFLIGCNFRCSYCHNPDLIKIKPNSKDISQKDFFDYLKKRQGILDGVCVSGGEPLLFPGLENFLKKIKELGFLTKLDTNGTKPKALQSLINKKLIDYIAMDIKAPLDDYEKVCGVKVDVNKIQESIKIIMDSGLDYEFRSTVLPKFHSLKKLEKLAKIIKGAKIFYIQNFNNSITLDPELKSEKPFTDKELEELKKIALKYVKKCEIRN